MVKDLHDLKVGVISHRQNHVASAKTWMNAPIGELDSEKPPDALGCADKAVRPCGEGNVVQAHANILNGASLGLDAGVGLGARWAAVA